jgi:chromosomal replication initiation ATPase DnaA
MFDRFLFNRELPVEIIQKFVSKATGVPVDKILLKNREPNARKREYVTARQISMKLAKMYSKKSLSQIGKDHNGYDHATIIHSIETIDNLLETRDIQTMDFYWKAFYSLEHYDESDCKQVKTILNTEK